MQITYFGTCDLASITREGKLNLLGIFRQIFVRQLPTKFLKFTIVAIISDSENNQHQLQLKITSPDKKDLLSQNINLKINQSGTANMFFEVINLPIHRTGKHLIQLSTNNHPLSQTTLEVVKVTDPPASQTVN